MNNITFNSFEINSNGKEASSLLTIEDHPSIQSISFDYLNEKVFIQLNQEIDQVQLWNNNDEIKFQFPISSNKIELSRAILAIGINKLGFKIDKIEKIIEIRVKT